MDKIDRIKRLVESSLDTSFGEEISIVDMVILPTQKYDEETSKWVPDSHSIFLSIKRTDNPKLNGETHQHNLEMEAPSRTVTNFLEGLLGIEVCVDVV